MPIFGNQQYCGTSYKLAPAGDIDFNAATIIDNKHYIQYKDKRLIVYDCTSNVKNKLVFVISHKTEIRYGHIPNFGNVCYAYTPAKVYDNKLLRNTFSMTFDKAFTYNGNIISATTNIFEIESITNEIDEYESRMRFCGAGADLVLDFSDRFFRNCEFDTTEEHIVTFSCETSDGKFFVKTINVKFQR